jgi:hypothetical protein
MSTTHPTTRAARPFFKLRAYPFNVFSSRLWFFDGNSPTNPLIASERRKIFPCRESLSDGPSSIYGRHRIAVVNFNFASVHFVAHLRLVGFGKVGGSVRYGTGK